MHNRWKKRKREYSDIHRNSFDEGHRSSESVSHYHQSKRPKNSPNNLRNNNNCQSTRKEFHQRKSAPIVGGKLPDRWDEYTPYNQYLIVRQLKLRGVLPCKTFLDRCFDSRMVKGEQSRRFWRPSTLFEIAEFKAASLESLDAASVEGSDERFQKRNENSSDSIPQDECPQDDEQFCTLTNKSLENKENPEQRKSMNLNTSDIGAVVNLCLTERHYSVPEMRTFCEYFGFSVEGRGTLPDIETILGFIELFAALSRRFPDRLVALHCTHGVNRTGFFCLILLLVFGGYTCQQAAKIFTRARGHSIYRQELLDGLEGLQKGTFLNERFQLFVEQISNIYSSDKISSSSKNSMVRLAAVPSVIELSDLFITILQSHHASPDLLYKPLGLLDMERVDDNSSQSGMCFIQLLFADDICAKQFERRWNTISLSNCLRSSTLPLNSISQREKFVQELQSCHIVSENVFGPQLCP